MVFAGIDVGTSGCKASVIDETGTLLCKAERGYGFELPAPGRVELNPVLVWENVKSVLKEIASKHREICAISVSSIGESVIPVNSCGKVLMNGITYLDTRGTETLEIIQQKFDLKKLHRKTGVPLNAMYTLCKLLWMQDHRPDVLEQAVHWFMFGDYIAWLLSGEQMIDPSSASRTMMFDAVDLNWDEEIGKTFHLPLDRFSKVFRSGTKMGKIRAKVAEETGLSSDVTVILGCHDQCSSLLGAGAVLPGDTMAGEGSTESINMVVEKSCFCDDFFENQLCFEPYLNPNQYIVPVGQLTHGISIRWFVENIGADFGPGKKKPGESDYDRANRECAKDCKDIFFLPYLSRVKSMDNDNHALGIFAGIDASTKKSEMFRALLEGLSFESKLRFDLLKQVGLQTRNITASGGCSKSSLLMQIKADVLQEKIQILENPESGGMGLAMICAVANGVFKDYKEAAEHFVKIKCEYVPQKDYSDKYKKYCILSKAAKELYRIL